MKLVAITGGLGNQMFIYAFMVRLSQMHKSCLFHPYKDSSKKYGQEGFQLEEVFTLRPVDHKKDIGLLLFGLYWHVTRIFPKGMRSAMLALVGVKVVNVAENFVFYPEVLQSEPGGELFVGTWQSERFFQGAEQEVRKAFTFKEWLLNEKTRQLVKEIEKCESVSLHVRRGDYLSMKYTRGFGGICTQAYYLAAIKSMKDRIAKPRFFVFSDDLDWCKANLNIPDVFFVDWNRGAESWQDMYLMSKCKHNIIANSSFSWWGAWLNANPEKIVVAPKQWWNGIKDDVVPETWIRISGN